MSGRREWGDVWRGGHYHPEKRLSPQEMQPTHWLHTLGLREKLVWSGFWSFVGADFVLFLAPQLTRISAKAFDQSSKLSGTKLPASELSWLLAAWLLFHLQGSDPRYNELLCNWKFDDSRSLQLLEINLGHFWLIWDILINIRLSCRNNTSVLTTVYIDKLGAETFTNN